MRSQLTDFRHKKFTIDEENIRGSLVFGQLQFAIFEHNEVLQDTSLNGARKFMGNIGPWNGHRLDHGLFGAQQKHEEPDLR